MQKAYSILVTLSLFLGCRSLVEAQQIFCPPNINFEAGNLSGWQFYTGTNSGANGITNLTATAALANRHVLTSGNGTDYYGGFPVVDPAGGSYSLKLGNDGVNAQVDMARYTFTIPASINNYSLNFRYAVVFEDPTHATVSQPFFRVRVFNAATNQVISCASFTYVPQPGLAGFSTSVHEGVYGHETVYYKPWSAASLNLSGQAGNTLVLEFTSADCALGAHMGYGYVDVGCGLFNISTSTCNTTSPLSAPPGFQTYTWYNAAYTQIVGTGQNITIPTPSVLTQYHVVLVPFPGGGCSDTLTTEIRGSALTVNAGPDTAICTTTSVTLSPAVTGTAPPYSYNWTPATGLSCTACSSPIANPASNTTYIVTVTDSLGCIRKDTINVTARLQLASSAINAVCYGSATGSATASASLGTPPYAYSWNTVPAQTTATASNVAAGTYTVTLTDARGCARSQTVSIGQSPQVVATIPVSVPVACFGGSNGSATAAATGGVPPYTYSWNTSPVQNGATANGLTAGTYVVSVTDAQGCIDTQSILITQPPGLSANIGVQPPSCYNGSNGTATVSASGGTSPYLYAWNTTPAQTTATAQGLSAGAYVMTLTDAHGCQQQFNAVLSQPAPVVIVTTASPVSCTGGNDGSVSASATGSTAPYVFTWTTNPVVSGATVSNLSAGSYTVTAVSSLGCIGTGAATVIEPAPLTASVVTTGTCSGLAQGAAYASAGGGNAPYTFTWTGFPQSQQSSISPLPAGTYHITITDAKGCTAGASGVVQLFPSPLVSVSGDSVICRGSGVQLVAAGASTYTWTPPTGLSCANCSSTNASPDSAITYLVKGVDANGCIDTTAFRVRVIQRVPVAVDPKKVICPGQPVRLGATGGVAWQWSPANLVDSAFIQQPMSGPQQSTVYQVVIRENVCFSDTLHQEVEVIPLPTVDLGPDLTVISGATIQLHAQTQNTSSILWAPADGLTCTACFDPSLVVRGKKTYSATVLNSLGCPATDTVTIYEGCSGDSYFFANIFTPNGDGQNDRFYPQAAGNSPIQHFMIYDRWGEIVFSSTGIFTNDAAAGWDGTFKGQALKPDVYVYVMDALCEGGQKVVLRGDVTLIR